MSPYVCMCDAPGGDERLVWIVSGVTRRGVPEPGVLCIGRQGPWFPSQCLGSRRTVSSLRAAWKLSVEISLWG